MEKCIQEQRERWKIRNADLVKRMYDLAGKRMVGEGVGAPEAQVNPPKDTNK